MASRVVKIKGPRRHIAVVTGTRAEYGLLRSTLEAIRRHPKLQLQLMVTGMHLLPRFGRTEREILADGLAITARVRMQSGNDSALDQASGLAKGIRGLAQAFIRNRTDIVLVLGDRIEAMAGALAAVTTGRFLAHIHGGDVAPGDFDDLLRNAISKMAHLHFPATQQSAKRLAAMGEHPQRIHVVGPVGDDEMPEALNGRGRVSRPVEDFALVVHHPSGRAAKIECRTMERIIDAAKAGGLGLRIIYPNSDRGHRGIIRAIRDARRRHGAAVQSCRSLPRSEYLALLSRARVLVGNSSSGLLEAGKLGTPAVNIGDRQRGRESFGGWVFHAQESPRSIRKALARALKIPRPTPQGKQRRRTRAGEKIAQLLAEVPIGVVGRRKMP